MLSDTQNPTFEIFYPKWEHIQFKIICEMQV